MTRCRVPRRGAVPRLEVAGPTKSQRPPRNNKEPLPGSTIDFLLVLLRDVAPIANPHAGRAEPTCCSGNRSTASPGACSRASRDLVWEPEPAKVLEIRAQVDWLGNAPGSSQDRPGLLEVSRQGRLGFAVPVGRPPLAAVVVADVAQAERRLGRPGNVRPETGERVEAVLGQQLPAFGRDQLDLGDFQPEDGIRDEVVEVDPDPARRDALAARGGRARAP